MFAVVYQWAKLNLRREEGQAMAEYGIIIALVAVALITALGLLTTDLSGVFSAIGTALSKAVGA